MRYETALKELATYLTEVQVGSLRMTTGAIPSDLSIIYLVSGILEEYNSTQENEWRVRYLLAIIIRYHFRKPEILIDVWNQIKPNPFHSQI